MALWGIQLRTPQLFSILLLLNAVASGKEPFIVPENLASAGFHLERADIGLWTKRIGNGEWGPSENLGFENQSNSKTRMLAVMDGKLLWDVEYLIDSRGHRIGWSKPQPVNQTDPRSFLVFLGCSLTFGFGVDTDETLPSQVARLVPETRVYNAGVSGAGTNHTLSLIQSENFGKLYPQHAGLFVYTYFLSHLARSNGHHPDVNWTGRTISYKKVNGRMIANGSFEKTHPWRSTFFKKIGEWFYPGSFFPTLGKKAAIHTCDLIEEAAKVSKEKYPASSFVVVEHPTSGSEDLNECLRSRSIPILQPRLSRQEAYFYPKDGHPTALFNETWAPIFFEAIKPYIRAQDAP